MKLNPEGKLLMTIGVKGHRGDWDEAKEQRLLWQPVMVAFGSTGDVYIAEGHANESPNDTDSGDPTNNIGAARVIHLDKNGKFIGQFFGNEVGQGKFDSVHGLAIDPRNGDVWIGDREQYRIVVYTGDGKFLKTIQMRNLVCALYFDSHGEPWMASGQDGQFLKLDRNGQVLGAIGKGMGIEAGQFIATLEKRQGLKVACPEEIAYRSGWITAAQLEALAEPMRKNGYGHYLQQVLRDQVY